MGLTGSNKLLVVIAAVIAVLAVAAIAAAALTSGREPPLLAANTPEGTVQRYLRAIQNKQYQEAYDYVASDLTSDCSYETFVSQMSSNQTESIQASLAGTRTFDDHVDVTVKITSYYKGRAELSIDPFSNNSSSYDQVFQLKQVGDGWKFSEWPWPVYGCPSPPIKPLPAAS